MSCRCLLDDLLHSPRRCLPSLFLHAFNASLRRMQGAIRLQQAIVHKAFEICSDKDMQKYGSFTACRIVAGRDSEVCPPLFTSCTQGDQMHEPSFPFPGNICMTRQCPSR